MKKRNSLARVVTNIFKPSVEWDNTAILSWYFAFLEEKKERPSRTILFEMYIFIINFFNFFLNIQLIIETILCHLYFSQNYQACPMYIPQYTCKSIVLLIPTLTI